MAGDLLEIAFLEEDEDLVFLALQPDKKGTTYSKEFPRFNFEGISEEESLSLFRFHKDDIRTLSQRFGLPETLILRDRSQVSGIDALCVCLRRLAYPNRLVDLERLFGRPNTTLSLIFNEVVDRIYTRYGHLVTGLEHQWLSNDHLTIYARKIHLKGAPLMNCFGFIDGTVRPICRPTKYQRVCYNGHKRVHSLKFQSVMLPNGIIANMYGPIEGRRHDCYLLRKSNLIAKMEQNIGVDGDGNQFALYGDPAYPVRPQLLSPYKGQLTAEQNEFNTIMSSVRETVEWGFQKILANFAFLDYKKNLKLLLQPVGKYYIVGTILTNCHTCLYGSQTGLYFQLDPPTLQDYLEDN